MHLRLLPHCTLPTMLCALYTFKEVQVFIELTSKCIKAASSHVLVLPGPTNQLKSCSYLPRNTQIKCLNGGHLEERLVPKMIDPVETESFTKKKKKYRKSILETSTLHECNTK